jgi:hypothetical protein
MKYCEYGPGKTGTKRTKPKNVFNYALIVILAHKNALQFKFIRKLKVKNLKRIFLRFFKNTFVGTS